jgi:4-oxalocrotonate tautomerase
LATVALVQARHNVHSAQAFTAERMEDHEMPLIEVHLIEEVFTPEQKREIIAKMTDAMVAIRGENVRDVTWVKISEVASGDWGIAGQPLTAEAAKVVLGSGRKAA